MNVSITKADVEDGDQVAELVKELLHEIMVATGQKHFRVDASSLRTQARSLLANGSYMVFLALDSEKAVPCGFIALFEGYALYTNGPFGVIPELYVRPDYRSQGIGTMLLDHAATYAKAKGWSCLEVTTPPLPVFERTLDFYEKHGFSVAGGKKLKRIITS